jgi:hypothetical protein
MAGEFEDKPVRAAKRKEKKEPADWAKKSVGLDTSTHTSLVKSAEKLSISKAKYAGAAIRYFTENGLDPTKAGVSELAQLRTQIGETTYEIRKQNVDIGNRLVAIMRTWEANQYKFLQAQQGGLLGYLESVEANILNHQVAVESQLLAPILERIVRGGLETHLHRMLTEILLLKFKDKDYPFSGNELKLTNANYDGQLDQRFISHMRKLLEDATVAAPKTTQKPILAVPIVGSPAKPTAPTPKPVTPTTPATTAPVTPKV